MPNLEYTYVWEYRVRSDAHQRFRQYYGPDGHWVRLFRRAPGYVSTELYHDRLEPDRYVTIDHWESEKAFRAFRERFGAAFEELDRFCESLTVEEASLGAFHPCR